MKKTLRGGPKADAEIDVPHGMEIGLAGGTYVLGADETELVWREASLPEAIRSSAQQARASSTPVRSFVSGMKAAADGKGCTPCRKAWAAAQRVVGPAPAEGDEI